MIAVSPDVKRVCALTPLQEGLLVESLAAPATGLYLEQIVAELPNGEVCLCRRSVTRGAPW